LLDQLVGLDDVPDLDVGVRHRETTLEARADLGGVVLLTTQRGDGHLLRDHVAVADEPCLGVSTHDAVEHHTTGDVAHLGRAEHLTDLRLAELLLLVDRLEHALERALDLLDRLVDDRVVPDVHAFAVGHLGGLALRADVEPDDHPVGRRGQVDVGLGDRTDAPVDDPQLHFVLDLDPHQGLLERLDGARVVALDDEIELTRLLEVRVQVLEAAPRTATGRHRIALARVATVRSLAGRAGALHHHHGLAGTTDAGESDDLDWARRARLLDVLTVLVDHPTHETVGIAGDDRVADPQGVPLDEHRGHRAAAADEVRLDGHTLGTHVRVGPQVQRRIRGEHDGLEQGVDVEPLLGGDVDEHGVAAVFLRDQAVFGQLTTDLLRLRGLLVDLVDRDHDRDLRRLGVVDGLDRLRHHAVVGRDHDDRDVGRLGTPGTHSGERLVARGVDEGDGAFHTVDLGIHLVG